MLRKCRDCGGQGGANEPGGPGACRRCGRYGRDPEFAVAWRAAPRAAWQIQPYLYPAEVAEQLAHKLVDQFGGEAITAFIDTP